MKDFLLESLGQKWGCMLHIGAHYTQQNAVFVGPISGGMIETIAWKSRECMFQTVLWKTFSLAVLGCQDGSCVKGIELCRCSSCSDAIFGQCYLLRYLSED